MAEVNVCKSKYCISCGKRLFDAWIKEGVVRIICKCGVLNIIEATPAKKSQKAIEPQS